MTDTTTTPQQPSTPADSSGQAPATQPATPAAPAGEQTPAPATNGQGGTPQQPAQQPAQQGAQQGEPKFTQADLDRIINDRITRERESQQKQWMAALGIQDPNAAKDPQQAAKAAQEQAATATQFAVDTLAEAVALSAGIKPDRVPVFLAVAKQAGLLTNVDLAKPTEARTALTAALTAKAGEFPEWKASTVAPSSGGDRGVPQNGKRQWAKSELDNMSHAEMEKNLPEVQAALAEGRVDFNR